MHRILVVDDEADICDVVKTGFEASGRYRVECANRRLDAFAALRRAPDLAILDMLMRENAGGAIETLAGELHVPVLRMTGHPEIIRSARAQGLPVLAKPFRVAYLVDIVDQLLAEAQRLNRQLEENMRTAQQLAQAARASAEARPLRWEDFAEHWRRMCNRMLKGDGAGLS